MNRNKTIALIALSMLIAVAGVSSAVKANNRKNTLETENSALRKQLAGLKDQPANPAVADSADTTPLVVAQQSSEVADAAPTAEPTPERPQRESREDRMARMKEEDPEGYAEMVKRREEFQETMKYNLAERTATFMDLDTANMNKKELAAHEQLVNRMGAVWDLMEQMQSSDGMNREVMGDLFRAAQEIRPLMEQERSTMFRLLGEDLGYKGKEAKDFAKHIDSIISSTSLQIPRGGRGRGGR